MNIKTKRYSELDLYKGIGIIATVTAASGMLSKVLQYRFDAVCFPLFMMAAGALWHKRGFETDEKEAVRQGFKKTMMPFFWFTLIYLLIDSVGMFVSPLYTLKATYSDLWDSVSFVGISVLWFLPAYFIGVTAYRVFRHNFRLVIICIILTAVAFSLTGILFYKGYSGMYDAGDVEVCLQSYGLRIALLFWRSSVGMFFCAFGEVFCLIGEKLSEKKLRVVALSVRFTGEPQLVQNLSVLVIALPHDSQNGMVYLLGLIDVTVNDSRNDGMWEGYVSFPTNDTLTANKFGILARIIRW